jgi:segregation and condensation protein B
MSDNTGTDVWTDVPAETRPGNDVPADLDEQSDDDTDVDSGFGLGVDVANAPELEDSELGAVLEALLLVVDTPVTVDQLAAATEQPAYRVGAKLALMAEELKACDRVLICARPAAAGGCTPGRGSRPTWSACCSTDRAPS